MTLSALASDGASRALELVFSFHRIAPLICSAHEARQLCSMLSEGVAEIPCSCAPPLYASNLRFSEGRVSERRKLDPATLLPFYIGVSEMFRRTRRI